MHAGFDTGMDVTTVRLFTVTKRRTTSLSRLRTPCLARSLVCSLSHTLTIVRWHQVMSLVGPSLDMLAAMVEGCPGLTDALLDTAFPALMRLLINTDDVGVMGAGVVFSSFVVFSAAFCRPSEITASALFICRSQQSSKHARAVKVPPVFSHECLDKSHHRVR